MKLNNLEITDITRVIAHTIHPKAKETDAYASHIEFVLSFSQSEKDILISRLHGALNNSKKTFKLDFEDTSENSIYHILNNDLPLDDDKFIEYSQSLANDLANAHFRIKIPGGYCLIGEGKTKRNEYFFFAIKAELQEVFSIEGNDLNLIKDVFLSPAKDFYKIGFFIKNGNNFTPFMYDDLFNLQKKDLTEYFYSQFLGLTTDKNDSLKSKNFFIETKSFIENNIDNTKDRLGLIKALTVLYREETSGILSPKDFSDKYFEGELKTKFEEIISTKYPHSFTKNLTLIDKQLDLKRLSIPLSYNLSIVGNSDSLEDVEVISNLDEINLDDIEPQINNGTIKKVILIKERKIDKDEE